MLREKTLKAKLLGGHLEARVQIFAEGEDEPVFENVSFGEEFSTVNEILEFVLMSADDFCDSLYEAAKNVTELTVKNRKGH